MSGIEKPSKHTPVKAQDVYDLFIKYLDKHWGRNHISHVGVMALVAQTVLESGHYKYVRNYNLGGIKAAKKWKGDWQHFTTREYLNTKLANRYLNNPEPDAKVELIAVDAKGIHEMRFSGRHSVNKFVSFDTLEAYCDYHIKFLLAGYKPALLLAMAGDVRGFSHELRKLGYYTAPAEDYARNVVSLSRSYTGRITRNPDLPDTVVVKATAAVEPQDVAVPTVPSAKGPVKPSDPPQIVTVAASTPPDAQYDEPNADDIIAERDPIMNLPPDSIEVDEKEDVILPQIGKRAEIAPKPWWKVLLDLIIRLFVRNPMP